MNVLFRRMIPRHATERILEGLEDTPVVYVQGVRQIGKSTLACDLANIERLTDMPRLLALLASRVGQLINYADLARTLAIPQTTLKRHMALLEISFLVRPLRLGGTPTYPVPHGGCPIYWVELVAASANHTIDLGHYAYPPFQG